VSHHHWHKGGALTALRLGSTDVRRAQRFHPIKIAQEPERSWAAIESQRSRAAVGIPSRGVGAAPANT
jgi:hypothetical protein